MAKVYGFHGIIKSTYILEHIPKQSLVKTDFKDLFCILLVVFFFLTTSTICSHKGLDNWPMIVLGKVEKMGSPLALRTLIWIMGIA